MSAEWPCVGIGNPNDWKNETNDGIRHGDTFSVDNEASLERQATLGRVDQMLPGYITPVYTCRYATPTDSIRGSS